MTGQVMVSMSCSEFEQMLEKIVDKVLEQRFEPLKKKYEEKLITREEVIKLLRISPPTLWRMQNRGDLNPVKVGRRIMFRESEVTQLINT